MQSPLLDTSIIDLLEADPRPSFIVARALPTHPPTVVYTNPALNGYQTLLDLTARQDDHDVLWKWITSPKPSPGPAPASPASVKGGGSFSYMGIFWTRSIVTEEMVVVGANEVPYGVRLETDKTSQESDTTKSATRPTRVKYIADHVKALVKTSLPSPVPDRRAKPTVPAQPTSIPLSVKERPPSPSNAVHLVGPSASDPGLILPEVMPEQRPFLEVINGVNWAATPLGPMDTWPPRLEQTFNQILVDSRPIAIYWGPLSTTIYNEAFSKLCGLQHPAMLGMPVEDTWGDAGTLLKEKLLVMSNEQRGSEEDEWRFFVERESEIEGGTKWLEEIFLKFSLIPIIENGEVLGFTHTVAETTSVRLWERRMKMLIDLGDVLATARDVRSYWETALQQLAAVEPYYDIPMAILYSVEDDPDFTATATSQLGLAKICRLAGTLAVPEKHPAVPPTINLRTGQEPLTCLFRKSLEVAHPLLLQTSDGTLPQTLLDGLAWRDYNGDPCRSAVMCSIRPTKEENVMGFLLLGLNPRRPYDNDYRQYISLLAQKLTSSLAAVVLLEEEARRGRNAAEQAAYDQAMLKEKLEVQTKEANESLQLFEAVAEFVPVGMCFNDPQGNITYANDAWYKITGCPPGACPIANEEFLMRVKEEDRGVISAAFEKLTTEKSNYTEFEFRVKKHPDLPLIRKSPSFEKAGLDLVFMDEPTERYVLAITRAERAQDGTIIRILTCLTDVTVHRRTAEEAVRRAQQAENLTRIAEFATVGMYDMDLEGRLISANNVFFEMCGLEKVDLDKVNVIKPWELSVVEEHHSLLTEKIAKMVAEDKVQNVEVRLKTEWAAEDGKLTLPRWVQTTLMPVRSSEGVIQSFTGCLSDVSLQKWQLETEKERKEEAIESKRQQENFIDMTSHEMRNPLSAIIHCADAITATLNKVQEILGGSHRGLGEDLAGNYTQDDDWNAEVQECLESSIDSAETIVRCVQHQKCIVDDILTMSKLDSKLLTITPITVDPIIMVQEALKMFEVEARRVDINLSMVVDQSYRDLKITYLDFDPSRLKQVLINLLTNALKFTKTGPTRNVSVAISASLSRPTEATSKVRFIPRTETDSNEEYDCNNDSNNSSNSNNNNNNNNGNDNGRDPVFVMFEVQDTGQGLSDEEKKSLFQRFVQASSRTHVKYGGSGLGLFISRRLTELQGGQIGVASQPGVGSTFAFYIEAYVPTEESIKEAEISAAAAKAAAFATLRAGATNALSKRTNSSDSTTTPTSASRQNTLAATPISEISSPSSMFPTLASPSPPSQIHGVLVVEDNVINQQITRRGLANMGFNVDVANHGMECLEKLRLTDRYIAKPEDEDDDGDESEGGGVPITLYSATSRADSTPRPKFPLSVILMDIEMPIQDGLTCTRNIRELEKSGRIAGGRIPIIAVSANARLEQIMEAKEAGCDDVLVKPYRMPELLKKMQSVLASIAGDREV
ncbi:putative signal transduction histidine-protein kinase [Cladorrhinum samala]|uniref:Signal transduction histidine-protein kinase n=1 Tax=Cladorrhinum samala TaxID=585594 RepID=A0AAV9I751_9PEZI|nr:putative signal transduction histidine-protein kinase [Cladorrhinum samala]